MDLLVVALALGLGFVLGIGVGAARAFRLAAQRRAVAGASGALARLMPEGLPKRSVVDMVSGQIHLRLGGQVYTMPILARNPAAEWRAKLDESWASLAGALETASDDTPAVVALLMSQPDKLLAALRAYDVTGVLPEPEWIDDYATDAEVFLGVVELWRSANPFPAAVAEMASTSETTSTSPGPSSSSPTPTAGVPTTSTAS
jgi:hypothetical protein